MSKNLKVLSISSSYIDSKNKDLTFSASTSLLVGKLPSYKRFSNRYISLIKFTIPRLSYKPNSSYLYLYIENYQNTNAYPSYINISTTLSNIDTSITNILPTNKFSEALPQLSSGSLGPMEISGSSVSYEVFGVNNSTYGDYVQSLLDNGYVMSSDGSYIKGNYQVFTTITQDGNMSIKLIDISNNSINV